jgi:two-component system, LuxR family, response regulator FixJ
MVTSWYTSVLIVVEDDAPLLTSLKWAFEVEGYQVRAFPDAESLLAEPELPLKGCLILDYRLPDVDGLELLRRLRARGVTLPAVLITTPGPGVVSAARAAGVPLIEKPLNAGTLIEQVRDLSA